LEKHRDQDPQQLPEGSDFRSLKHQLQAVNLEDPAAVITVREIKNLIWPGATVEERLRQYFEAFGAVKDVLVPRAAVKHLGNSRKHQGKNAGCRVRSSNVGWVVMESADSVPEILRCGQHVVDGVMVRVEEFRRSSWDGDGAKPMSPSTDASTAVGTEEDGTSSSHGSIASIGQHEQVQHSAHQTWAAHGLQVAGMVQDATSPEHMMQCHPQMQPWPQAMPIPTALVSADNVWGQMIYTPCAVFHASEQELRSAMPECYDD